MNRRNIAFLLAFWLLCGLPFSVLASTEKDDRYFIRSTSNFWKNTLGVRNTFSDGFTSDLTDWEIRLTKIFGVEILPVKKFYVLPESTIEASEEKIEDKSDFPATQIPWGVASIYQSLKKPTGGKDIKVAVLDTGVYIEHSDLKSRISGCKDFTSLKSSIIDNFCEDKNGHGTHVAGIISADGGEDGLGIYGIAPESNLLAYKVCDDEGLCWADDVASAMKVAVDEGAQIINLSLGGDSSSSLVGEAIKYANEKKVLIVASAGNDGPYDNSIDYPSWDGSIVSVGAIDVALTVPDWSSRGFNTKTDPKELNSKDLWFVAPGVNIESTWIDGNYAILSGTSMASPHIAGLIAKLWQSDNEEPIDNVVSVLKELLMDVGDPGEDNASGLGFPHL